ncbi:Hypothetical predicted protein [Paramuricea clavata]|uniref:Uncharacterized protein n=2 Tax=Paramuricea clavata TaxID=317549 RepID=A0A7D9ISY5_PARCT|nr:Hypothetical predicted protein [Paramuricea clavata]
MIKFLELALSQEVYEYLEELDEMNGSARESPGVGGGRSSGAEVRKLKEQNLQLKEENNLLQYKIEILLDMLAANKADLMVLEEEVDVLTKQKSTRIQ